METKSCTGCKIEQPLTEFYLKRGKPRAQCKTCHSNDFKKLYQENKERYDINSKKWRIANKDRMNDYRIKYKYNLLIEDYQNMINTQNNLCAICSNPETAIDNYEGKIKSLAIDHCHTTKKVRGLLCSRCNHALGLFKDNIENLKKAIEYLEKFKTTINIKDTNNDNK